VPTFEFVGPDPIDHFHLGRVSPGDVLDIGPEWATEQWKATKKRPSRATAAEQPPVDAEHEPDAPSSTEEV
jgi:hypothetical protein